jgi:oligopeptide/dipeptide ABC transporter ATP-binding protein
MKDALPEVSDLRKHYPVTGGLFRRTVGTVRAVDGISFDVEEGSTLGLAGESGCGRSTAARTILRLEEPTSGTIRFNGEDFSAKEPEGLRRARTNMQMIFQDPYSSLNPRHTVAKIISEPLRVHNIGTHAEQKERVKHLLNVVGLPTDAAERYPYEFSGGQRQRVGIARALAMRPKLIIADEPVSSLDVSIRARILNLLRKLQDQFGLTCIFIAHDLALVKNMSPQIGIMYLGHLVETGPSGQVFGSPAHPYTQALIAAVPGAGICRRDRDRSTAKPAAPLTGDVPSPLAQPPGCPFHPRCPRAKPDCMEPGRPPRGVEVAPGHRVACNYPME